MRPGCPSTGLIVGVDASHLVAPGLERALEDVVGVGGDDQLPDRQAHALGAIAREDVAEIAGGDDEGHLAMRRAERRSGGEVVDDLRDDAAPVDRVDAAQLRRIAEALVC